MKALYSLTFLIIISLLISCDYFEQNQTEDKIEIYPVYEDTSNYLFDINVDTFSVFNDKIQKNQFLADILLSYNIPYPKIHQLAQKSKEIFDIRKLRYDKDYTILASNDTTAQYFIYEPDPYKYIVFDLTDSVHVEKCYNKVDTVVQTASGIITSSLYMTLINQNLSPQLAIDLSMVYAWTIDFYRIQKNDKFQLIYEQFYINEEPVGIGKVLAANFVHFESPNYAIGFPVNDIWSYYDDEANSLRQSFLQAPVKYTRISSRYQKRRFHPVQKRYKSHLGTDYAAPTGTPIMATGDGVVINKAYTKYNGRYVKIRHNSTFTTQYLHMSKFNSEVVVGTKVQQGDIIGYVGQTGLATGPHVCYRFWKNNEQVDPYTQDLPPGEPVDSTNMESFLKMRDKYKEELAEIKYTIEESLDSLEI